MTILKNAALMIAAAGALLPATADAARPLTLAQKMDSAGMQDARRVCPQLMVSMMYSRPDNFTGSTIYTDGSIDNCVYLHPEAVKALCRAQEELSRLRPGYRLLICDASRPMSAQRKMYKVVRGTPMAPYVSNPANGGGLHNYGLAVDVTICDPLGRQLPMGTIVDHLGKEANIDREDQLVAKGTITAAERDNRLLLRRVMKSAGWMPLKSEWWHFNLRSRPEARRRYRLLDF